MILFLDDEKWYLQSYLEELEMRKLKVVFTSEVKEAHKLLGENAGQIELMILDVMMPLEDESETQPDSGLSTGIRVYEKVRQKYQTLPIIIFTNDSDGMVEERFSKEDNCWFMKKDDYLPFELADEVEKILSSIAPGGQNG